MPIFTAATNSLLLFIRDLYHAIRINKSYLVVTLSFIMVGLGLASCGGSKCNSDNNDSGGDNGNVMVLQMTAPKIVFSNPLSPNTSYVVVSNPSESTVKNIHYSLIDQVGGAESLSIDPASAENCMVVLPNNSCNVKLLIPAGTLPGSLAISAANNNLTNNQVHSSNPNSANGTTVLTSLNIGVEQMFYANTLVGADGIAISYYKTIIDGTAYIMVTGYVGSINAGNFNSLALVDNNGVAIPNQQLIGAVSDTLGSTFSILIPAPADGSAQTIKIQTQYVANGVTTPVSTSTSSGTISITSNVGIADILPSTFVLTPTNPEQVITITNSGDKPLDLTSLIASSSNVSISGFSAGSLAPGASQIITLKLNADPITTSNGTLTLSYNNGQSNNVITAVVFEKADISPVINTAGLMAVFTPDNDLYNTTTTTVSRQLVLTNTGNTTENNFVFTFPSTGTWTLSPGINSGTSCAVTGNTVTTSLTTNGSGDTCIVTVSYANTTAVAAIVTADVTINYKYAINQSATKTTPVDYRTTQSTANLAISPNALTFNNIINNGIEESQLMLKVINSGDNSTSISALSITGTDAALFSIVSGAGAGTCAVNSSLASNESCTVAVKFGPAANTITAAQKNASLSVSYLPYSSATATSATASLSGRVAAAQSSIITVNSTTGASWAGGTGGNATPYQVESGITSNFPSITFELKNTGPVPATDVYISTSGSTNWVISGNCGTLNSKITLAAGGGTCNLILTINSSGVSAVGAVTLTGANYTINLKDQDDPSGTSMALSSLAGYAAQYVNAYAPPVIRKTPNSMAFARGVASSESLVMSFNNNTYVATNQTLSLTGMPSGITVNPTSCNISTVNANSTCYLTVTSTATTALGTYNLTLTNSGSVSIESSGLAVSVVVPAPEWAWMSGESSPDALGVYGTKGTAALNNIPGARDRSISWSDSSGNLWLFGGYGYTATSNGL
jgi:hypothetical protein